MFEDVVQALQAWFDHYGHFDVPIDWQVPTHSCLREGVETELGAASAPEDAVLNDGDAALDKVRDARHMESVPIDDFSRCCALTTATRFADVPRGKHTRAPRRPCGKCCGCIVEHIDRGHA